LNLLIAERSRSVRALFAVQRRATPIVGFDTGALIMDSSTFAATGNTLQAYQYRIGSRYFPAAPVQVAHTLGGADCNGGAEAFLELQKSLNCVGDYRLSTSLTSNRWAIPPATASLAAPFNTPLPELDYATTIIDWNAHGSPTYRLVQVPGVGTGNTLQGGVGSAAFTMAIDLQTSNGVEIAGLNAEEQVIS